MNNSLLNNSSFSTLIRLRNYFDKKSKSMVRSESSFDDPVYLKYKDFVSKIDDIIDEKFLFQISNEDQSHLPFEEF